MCVGTFPVIHYGVEDLRFFYDDESPWFIDERNQPRFICVRPHQEPTS